MDAVRLVWSAVVLLGLAPFADTVRLTLGQRFVTSRSRDRRVMIVAELAALALWAALRYGARADRPLVPAAAGAVAAIAGLVLTAAGMGLAAWAKVRLGRWFSGTFGVKPGHELVTDGAYGVTRHPIYTGLGAAVAGSALVWDSALTLALAAAFAAAFWRHAVVEERLFVQHFGEAYRRYQRRVPRLVPLAIRPGRSDE
jgi:protein-S-isoprenylcysteine O-methyltransferase Ste14